ncbi:hypothetical protein RhiirA5_352198 [Rhizophagus irregularis]|uniref:MATA-HMG n=1 Tax=Rhizophagus irregularis TaxID=588596 RepID=A0A1B1EVJ4_9GLOM|nr:MATA-HMG [Rhizophagus irregularis]PKC13041.1 hypothetical protein RhiirA5_352198 [Rhizophagus irregularis]
MSQNQKRKQKLNKPARRGYCVFTVEKNGEKSLPPPPSPPDPRSAIRFDIKSDEDIVYQSNYIFNIKIEVLINNSTKSRCSKNNEKNGTKNAPRRQNAWILYRRDKSMNKEFEGLTTAIVSLKIREMWEKEPWEVKELFSALSRLAEKRHIEQYGKNYRYQPVHMKKSKPNQQNKRNKRKVKKINKKLNNCEFFTTTLDYFTPENETMKSPPSNDNKDINDTNSTFNNTSDSTSENFLPPIEYDRNNNIWQDPMLKFKLNDEYSFVNNFIEIDETNEINEKNEFNENTDIETYGIFS